MLEKNIRNFAIISHIDHGKSTLADRFLELTGTVEKRKMRAQYLDQMELEQERGITIKLQPVRMEYGDFVLNLIDTPGHIDFSYEVSRSLKAVEGVILLVDATQGVQAQTISNLDIARSLKLSIVPVVNKIDSPRARTKEVKKEICEILDYSPDEVLEISAKTGENVSDLLDEIVKRIPSPETKKDGFRGLVFDFEYSLHQGVILYLRVFGGLVKKGDSVFLYQANQSFSVQEVGVFIPEMQPKEKLGKGEIGYVVTNIKESGIAQPGDTLLFKNSDLSPLEGYKRPESVVWASVYPEKRDEFETLKQALKRLNLEDSALAFEEEGSGVLGRGFRCGFLGMLHLEIVIERLRREFGLKLVTAMPTVVYNLEKNNGKKENVYSPALFPDQYEVKKVFEPWVEIKIISPYSSLGDVLKLLKKHGGEVGDTEQFGQSEARLVLKSRMPLREMMKNFFEELKSVSEGYASMSYKIIEKKEADLLRADVLLNNEIVPAFSRVLDKKEVERESQLLVERLKNILPRALFTIKIQVKAGGKILAARSLSALKKDVTGHLYGGDRTRKMKLWQKQKKGKKKLRSFGKVQVPHDVFLKMIKNE